MVEVHDVRREHAAAIHAWDLAQFAKPRERRLLAARDALDLFSAMGRVVGDVVGALISGARHSTS